MISWLRTAAWVCFGCETGVVRILVLPSFCAWLYRQPCEGSRANSIPALTASAAREMIKNHRPTRNQRWWLQLATCRLAPKCPK